MPTLEGLEEAGLEKIPDLSIAKMRFELTLDADSAKELKIDQSEVINIRLYYYLYIKIKQMMHVQCYVGFYPES